jgi:hypothetical protein
VTIRAGGSLREREDEMRQKYVISLNGERSILKIKEYAVIDKNLKHVASSMLRSENFSLLCEETYQSDVIMRSISKGLDHLVQKIRTLNMYPVEAYATKIAESVMALYQSSDNDSVELFFDDRDLMPA